MKSLDDIRADNGHRTVICRRCQGHGRHDLGPELARTIAAVDRTWRSTEDVRKRIGSTETAQCKTAINNRLVDLVREGLVERRRVGRGCEWRLK